MRIGFAITDDVMQKALSADLASKVRGGQAHWVTIKEGPLEGRHLLIDGPRPQGGGQSRGKILAGHGIPNSVISKLGATHASDVPHKQAEHDAKTGEPIGDHPYRTGDTVTYQRPGSQKKLTGTVEGVSGDTLKVNVKGSLVHVAADHVTSHEPRAQETSKTESEAKLDIGPKPENKERGARPKEQKRQEPKTSAAPKESNESGPKSEQDIRTEEQAGRDIAYDVGEKVGGARKDVYTRHFIDAPTVQNLERLEHEAPELAQLYAKKKHVMPTEKEQLERDLKNGVEFKSAMLKSLIYGRIAPEPAEATPEGRKQYVMAIHELRRILEPIKGYEDMRNALRDLSYRAGDSSPNTIRYRQGVVDRYKRARNDPMAYGSPERREEAIKDYEEKIARGAEDYLKFPFAAMGEKLDNLLTDSKSRERTLNTLWKNTNGKDWGSFGLEQKENEKGQQSPRGEEKKRWERDAVSEHLRTGGRPTNVEKPEDMLRAFGIRGVEFGHWVDDASGKYHLKRSAEALHDLADMLDISDKDTSLNGRLALAFGARGKGRALAHYEPAKKVINMTKYGGAGSLAHEWGHALDNIMAQYANGGRAGLGMASAGGMGDHDAELNRRYQDLMDAIMKPTPGSGMSGKRTVQIDTEKKMFSTYYPEMRRMIQGGTSFEDTYSHFANKAESEHDARIRRMRERGATEKDIAKERRSHNRYMQDLPHRLAHELRYKDHDRKTGVAPAHIKETRALPTKESEYFSRMKNLDGAKAYYSLPEEMFARVFEAHMQHKLEKSGRYNNYLVHGTDARPNDELHPFPHGKERDNMFAKMEMLLDHITKNRALEKALKNEVVVAFSLRKSHATHIMVEAAAHEKGEMRMEKSQSNKSPCDRFKNEDGTFKGGFDGAVKYFMCQGHSEESATKIAGKIAAEKGEETKKSMVVMIPLND